MKIKENDKIPGSEIFVLENGEPIKKNIEDFLNKSTIFFLTGSPSSRTKTSEFGKLSFSFIFIKFFLLCVVLLYQHYYR